MKLYDYFRSSACYRVRIALNMKNIDYEKIEVHLINNGGEQHKPEYLDINPQGLVPTLDDDGKLLTQSFAIMNYLDELYPHPALLPKDPYDRAQVSSLALIIVCDIHPINNLGILNQLKTDFHADEQQITHWYHHWLKKGFDAFEKRLEQMKRTKPVCFGDSISLADICLVPQVYNANRFQFSLDDYPLIREINAYCLEMKAFQDAAP